MTTLFFVDDDLLAQVLGGRLADRREEIAFVTPDAALGRSLRRRGLAAISGRLDTPRLYGRAGLADTSRVVIHLRDATRVRQVVDQVHALTGDLPILVVRAAAGPSGVDDLGATHPGVRAVDVRDLVEANIHVELDHAATRRLVRRYQEDFARAERVLILLHDDPDPDSLAAALALRTLLGRKPQTAVIGAFAPVMRPENVRMTEMLDISVELLTDVEANRFDRIAVLDIQPHYWGDRFPRVDLVIDHHPPQKGYVARFRDLRPQVGATSTILLEHLRAAGLTVSARTATALLYAIKTDTLFLERGVHPADLRSFAWLYPRADLGMLRRIEGAGLTLERLEFIDRVRQTHILADGFLYAHIGVVPRDDIVPSVADFFMQLDDVKWCAVSGEVGGTITVSLRNLGHQKSAGEVARAVFGEIGNAGGHRAAAKAVIPRERFHEAFGGPGEDDGRRAAAVCRRLREAAGP